MLDGSDRVGGALSRIGDVKEVLQRRFGYAKFLQMLFRDDAEAELEDSVAISDSGALGYFTIATHNGVTWRGEGYVSSFWPCCPQ
jgi:hypothetical protein